MLAEFRLIATQRFRAEFIAQLEGLEQGSIVRGMFRFLPDAFSLNRDGRFQLADHVAAKFEIALPQGIDAGLTCFRFVTLAGQFQFERISTCE